MALQRQEDWLETLALQLSKDQNEAQVLVRFATAPGSEADRERDAIVAATLFALSDKQDSETAHLQAAHQLLRLAQSAVQAPELADAARPAPLGLGFSALLLRHVHTAAASADLGADIVNGTLASLNSFIATSFNNAELGIATLCALWTAGALCALWARRHPSLAGLDPLAAAQLSTFVAVLLDQCSVTLCEGPLVDGSLFVFSALGADLLRALHAATNEVLADAVWARLAPAFLSALRLAGECTGGAGHEPALQRRRQPAV